MLPEIIETERLQLRPYSLQDVDAVFLYASDPEWAGYLPVSQPYTTSDDEKFISGELLQERKNHRAWAIEDSGSVIGGIDLRFDFDNHVGEIGYSIARSFWGKGLTTEGARAVMNAAFSTYADLNRIRAMADERNTGSLRVMEKLGMFREGILRQNRFVRGEFINEVWFGVLRNEWET